MIYLDNAATSLHKPEGVAKAVFEAISTLGNASRGTYDFALNADRIIYDAREKLARLFNVKNPSLVAFTSNATESLNVAIKGSLLPGDHVITTSLEHNSVLRPLYEMENSGVQLTILPSDDKGCFSYEEMENAIKENTRIIVCTHASNLTGNLVDIKRVGEICHKHNLLFILDASQTAGVFPVDMEKDQIDILCFTGHKGLMGPQGTGGICLRGEVRPRPLITGGTGIRTFEKEHPSYMPTALEAGTLNAHGIAGLHAALSFIEKEGQENIRKKEQALAEYFYERVKTLPGVRIYGDFTNKNRAAIISLNLGEVDSGKVADELAQRFDIYTRSGGHCAPLMHETFGTEAQGMVRFSFSFMNTFLEADLAIQALKTVLEE